MALLPNCGALAVTLPPDWLGRTFPTSLDFSAALASWNDYPSIREEDSMLLPLWVNRPISVAITACRTAIFCVVEARSLLRESDMKRVTNTLPTGLAVLVCLHLAVATARADGTDVSLLNQATITFDSGPLYSPPESLCVSNSSGFWSGNLAGSGTITADLGGTLSTGSSAYWPAMESPFSSVPARFSQIPGSSC